MNRNKLYTFLLSACLAGYLWISLSFYNYLPDLPDSGLCPFRHLTHLPCPSCGSTRAILSILQGDFSKGFLYNPLGYFLLIVLIIFPLWIIFDLVSGKATFLYCYQEAELVIKRRSIALSFTLLVLINWVWNLYKY